MLSDGVLTEDEDLESEGDISNSEGSETSSEESQTEVAFSSPEPVFESASPHYDFRRRSVIKLASSNNCLYYLFSTLFCFTCFIS